MANVDEGGPSLAWAPYPGGVRLAPGAALPPAPGSYALIVVVERPVRIAVGRLGERDLAPGRYAYCGSALGGLRGRVGRHLRGAARPRWHVDYLLAVARVVEVWLWPSPERLECRLAAHLAGQPGAARPLPGFGASDCRCPGHLVRLPG